MQNLVWGLIANADGFRAAVDVVSDGNGVFARSWRDGDFDLWVGGGEFREERLDEAARSRVSAILAAGVFLCIDSSADSLHAP